MAKFEFWVCAPTLLSLVSVIYLSPKIEELGDIANLSALSLKQSAQAYQFFVH